MIGPVSKVSRSLGSLLNIKKTESETRYEQCFDFAFGLADHIYAMTLGQVVYESPKAKVNKTKLRKSVGV